MISILPMVDLLGNTAVDWFCILSYFRLDTLTEVCNVLHPQIFNQPHSLLDELVFKLSGELEGSAVLSLELMARLAAVNHSMVELISSRYTGVLELAIK